MWAYAYRIRSKYGTNTVMMHEHRCHTSARSFKWTSLGLIYCLIINSNNFSQHFRPLESTCLKLNSWCRTHTHITWTVETFNSISKVGSCLHFHERNRYIYRKNKMRNVRIVPPIPCHSKRIRFPLFRASATLAATMELAFECMYRTLRRRTAFPFYFLLHATQTPCAV